MHIHIVHVGKRPHASVDDAKREWQGGIFKEVHKIFFNTLKVTFDNYSQLQSAKRS